MVPSYGPVVSGECTGSPGKDAGNVNMQAYWRD
jgi:hypothetical protein